MSHLRPTVSVAAALLTTALCTSALAGEMYQFEVAGAPGVDVRFDGDRVVADTGERIDLTGELTIGVAGLRTTLSDAAVAITFVDGEVDTLIGTARVVPPGAGALPVDVFGDLFHGEVGLAYGNDLEHLEAPLQPDTRYLFLDVSGGPSMQLGPIGMGMGAGATLVLDPRDPAFFARMTLEGMSELTPIEEVAVGVSAHGQLHLEADTTWGLDGVDTAIDGHLYVGGRGEIPGTPITLDAEVVLDADPDDDGVTLFDGATEVGMLANGQAEVSVQFGPFPGFMVPVAAASLGAEFVGDDVDVWFSGESGIDLNDIVPELPITFRNQQFVAGRVGNVAPLYVQFGAEADVFGFDLADGLLRIDEGGATLAARADLLIADADVEGTIDAHGFDLTGRVSVDFTVEGPNEVTEEIERVVSYTANGAVCGYETVTSGAVCGVEIITDGARCGFDFITNGAVCGFETVWGWFCGWTGFCSRRSARSCHVPASCSIDATCDVPNSCDRDELEERVVHIPDFEIGSLEGALEVTMGTSGVAVDPDLELCLFGEACVPFLPASVHLSADRFEICGSFPIIGTQCFDACDVAGDLCGGRARATALPEGRAVYLDTGDADTLQAPAEGALPAACDRYRDDPRCKWSFEASATHPGAYLVRNVGDDACIEALDHTTAALRPCATDADVAGQQWYAEASPTRRGAVYLRSATGDIYLNAPGGELPGAPLAVSACPKDADLDACQWTVELSKGFDVPTHVPVYLDAVGADLSIRSSNGSVEGSSQVLAACARDDDDPSCQWIFEPSTVFEGALLIRAVGTQLCLAPNTHTIGAGHALVPCERNVPEFAGLWRTERSMTREDAVYIVPVHETAVALHSFGGNQAGFRQTLHPCPRGNDHANCQWTVTESETGRVPEDVPVYLRSSDSAMVLHAHGGPRMDGPTSLEGCGQFQDYDHCKWIFERSRTRPGAYRVRNFGTNLCLHAHGGGNFEARITLWDCAAADGSANVEWYVDRSLTRDAFYLTSAAGPFAMHTWGGTRHHAEQTLHTCERDRDYANCQWAIELPPEPAVPTHTPVYVRAAQADLFLHAHGGQNWGAHQSLHWCTRSANFANCQWTFEPSAHRPGAYFVRSAGSDLCLHAHGGPISGAPATLYRCDTHIDRSNLQWYLEPSQTSYGAFYLVSAGDTNLSLNTNDGNHAHARQSLGPCNRANDHSNCQWYIEP